MHRDTEDGVHVGQNRRSEVAAPGLSTNRYQNQTVSPPNAEEL